MNFGKIFIATILLVFMVSSFRQKEKHPPKPQVAYYNVLTGINTSGYPGIDIDFALYNGGVPMLGGSGTLCGGQTLTLCYGTTATDIYFGPAGCSQSPWPYSINGPLPNSAGSFATFCTSCGVQSASCPTPGTRGSNDLTARGYLSSISPPSYTVANFDFR